MKVKLPNRGLRANSLTPLQPVLNRWCGLVEKMAHEWVPFGDAPWWYNERASLSLFAGAVWLCRGWAFEEFGIWRTVKSRRETKHKSGRCDIEFGIGESLFTAEAKQCWPVLGKNKKNALANVEMHLEQARQQAIQFSEQGSRRLSMAFVIPRVPVHKMEQVDESLDEFLQDLLSMKKLAIAWTFPKETRLLRPPQESRNHRYIYPGIVLAMRTIGRGAGQQAS